MAIPTRTLGRTGLDVTVLGFGAMELRGEDGRRGRAISPEESERVLNAVLDSGINYIDTSIDYGKSEESIGQFISNRREEYFLASKCGCMVGGDERGADGRRPHIFTRENITAGVEQSLRRLRTDHLDLVQLHASPSKETLDQEGVVETLLDLQRDGKVRFIGSSSTLPNLPDLVELGVFDVFQIPYSALQREHEGPISEAAHAGAGTVIRGGVARGEPGSGQGVDDTWNAYEAAKLEEIADGASPTEFLLRFTITHPDMSTTIVGTRNPDHLAANVAAVEKGPLPADVYEEAKRRLDGVGITA